MQFDSQYTDVVATFPGISINPCQTLFSSNSGKTNNSVQMIFANKPPARPGGSRGPGGRKDHMPAVCAAPRSHLPAALASLFHLGRQEPDRDAQKRFRIKQHLLSLTCKGFHPSKGGRSRREGPAAGGGRGEAGGRGGGGQSHLLKLAVSLLSVFLPHPEAPSVLRLAARPFVFHSVTAYVASRL